MASAAEQLARNLNFSTFAKAKALQQRIMFTLGALLVYRLGTYIPVPGIDPDAYAATFRQAQQGIAGMFDMFAGGAVQRMAIFALNLIPYITASIVVQVVTTASPRLEALRKEGESGRRKLNRHSSQPPSSMTARRRSRNAVRSTMSTKTASGLPTTWASRTHRRSSAAAFASTTLAVEVVIRTGSATAGCGGATARAREPG
jgi:hypothetical protein